MKSLLTVIFFMPVVFATNACGVKGVPQPPLNPPLLGRGELSFSKATEGVKVKKKTRSSSEPDWDEPSDFSEEPTP